MISKKGTKMIVIIKELYYNYTIDSNAGVF